MRWGAMPMRPIDPRGRLGLYRGMGSAQRPRWHRWNRVVLQMVREDEKPSGTDLIENMSETVAIKILDFEPRWISAFGWRILNTPSKCPSASSNSLPSLFPLRQVWGRGAQPYRKGG